MNAPHDQNSIFGKLAVLNTDTVQGTNLVPIAINPSNGGIKFDAASTISFTMVPIAEGDENYQKVWLFEGTDGLTYPAVATAGGAILLDTP